MLDGIAIEDRNDYASCRGNVSLLGHQLSHIVFIVFELLLATLIGSPLLHVLYMVPLLLLGTQMGPQVLHVV